jgi:hypothetical protein
MGSYIFLLSRLAIGQNIRKAYITVTHKLPLLSWEICRENKTADIGDNAYLSTSYLHDYDTDESDLVCWIKFPFFSSSKHLRKKDIVNEADE